jgi:hypothetical protein
LEFNPVTTGAALESLVEFFLVHPLSVRGNVEPLRLHLGRTSAQFSPSFPQPSAGMAMDLFLSFPMTETKSTKPLSMSCIRLGYRQLPLVGKLIIQRGPPIVRPLHGQDTFATLPKLTWIKEKPGAFWP